MIDMIVSRAREMGIEITPEMGAKFAKFHDMLTRANAKTNLTRVPDDISEAVDRNYLDSITPLTSAIAPGAQSLADVGAGAGFPGIPLSIVMPRTRVTLIDALGKRVEFLESVITALNLNAAAVHARAEEAGRMEALRGRFDVVTSRAVAPINVLMEYSLPLLRVGGTAIAYKGPTWRDELASAQNALQKLGGTYVDTFDAPIPGRDWAHVLVCIKKTSETPDNYPRRPGMPEKRPL